MKKVIIHIVEDNKVIRDGGSKIHLFPRRIAMDVSGKSSLAELFGRFRW